MSHSRQFVRNPLLIALLIVVAVGVAVAAWLNHAYEVPPRESATIVRVKAGESVASVIERLHERSLAPSPKFVRMYMKVVGQDPVIHAGMYEIAPDASFMDILEQMERGGVITRVVTIPEGFELSQIIRRLSAELEIPLEDLDDVVNAEDASERFGVAGPTLEGYLYPATYTLPVGVAPTAVIEILANRHRQMWTDERLERARELAMTVREVVTLASILEAEALHKDEMPHMSAVFHNRLRRGMLLQTDATVQYALEGRRRRLLYATIDSVADSPYNTYKHPGLPPGPIGAVSEAAVDAALYPIDSPNLFFVARGDGRHVFTKTLADHNRAKRNYLQARSSRD